MNDLNPMSAAGDTYLNPTPGPSSLTEIVSDCVQPIPIFSGIQEKQIISYLNTKKKLQEMDKTTKRTILCLKNSIEKLREKYKKH
ncbi:hypothetical protein HW555_012838 [Spodoptera exigua]|uniref:Uncharacterized protein n=1 Tax=Spodoptera exigua TaxID=7107 RepID=A0A835G6R7_SPOEX|nr:hypothetical protein HW555_012838 [Spodoptera exigua]